MITLSMACGHSYEMGETESIPVCPLCGERRVQRVKTRAPRFRGVVLGPCAQFENLPGIPVSVGVPDGE